MSGSCLPRSQLLPLESPTFLGSQHSVGPSHTHSCWVTSPRFWSVQTVTSLLPPCAWESKSLGTFCEWLRAHGCSRVESR